MPESTHATHHRQLPDLRSHPGSFEHRFFDLAAMSGERVLASMGNRLELMTEAGKGLRDYPLEARGWSVLAPSPDEHFAYVGNWFSGQIVKLNLDSGELLAATNVAEKCMAGIAVFT